MKLTIPKRKMKKKKYRKRLFREFCFSLITFCTNLVAMRVDLILALFFPLLLGMFIGVDKRVGFRCAIGDDGYTFSYSGSRGKVQYLVFSNSC